MFDVFLSYKREDEQRVALLAEALSTAGLTVWWDRAIPGGENWRQTIDAHLAGAACVIVVWSKTSVGAAGEFVHEEAARAKSRGVLLPVLIDSVQPPLGFAELQALDLIGWRGSVRDRRFKNVVAAARAVVRGEARPRPQPPGARFRRYASFAAAFAVLATAVGFIADVSGLVVQMCRVPGALTTCAYFGLISVPTPAEDAIWSARQPGDCSGLRSYLSRFPNGAYADEADRRLQALEVRLVDTWTRERRMPPLVVRPSLTAFENERAAHDDALARAPEAARAVCTAYEVDGNKLITASATVRTWRCSHRNGGSVCGFDGDAVCHVDIRSQEKREFCP